MKKSRFTEEQIAFALRQAESGVPIVEVCRKMGISEQTFFRWKKKFAGMGIAEVRRLKQLEEENRKLKALVADLSPDRQILQDVLKEKRRRLIVGVPSCGRHPPTVSCAYRSSGQTALTSATRDRIKVATLDPSAIFIRRASAFQAECRGFKSLRPLSAAEVTRWRRRLFAGAGPGQYERRGLGLRSIGRDGAAIMENGPGWIRTPPVSCGKSGRTGENSADSGAQSPNSGTPTPPATPPDPHLAAVVAAWPDLPPAIRAGVLALVKAASPDSTNPTKGAHR